MARDIPLVGLVCLAFLVVAGMVRVRGTETETLTLYIQLVRGDNENLPPVSDAHRIGPKLSKVFKSVFKWDSYWEVNRQKVKLVRGQKTRTRLSREREVEIELTGSGTRDVVVFAAGKPVARSTRPIGDGMTIVGGERDAVSVWFVVVRRDPPTN